MAARPGKSSIKRSLTARALRGQKTGGSRLVWRVPTLPKMMGRAGKLWTKETTTASHSPQREKVGQWDRKEESQDGCSWESKFHWGKRSLKVSPQLRMVRRYSPESSSLH